jgi:hypothetical protein
MYDFENDAQAADVRRAPERDATLADPLPDRGRRPTGGPSLDAASLLGLQRTIGNAGVVQMLADEQEAAESPSPVHEVVGSGGGASLDSTTRSTMEQQFGQGFDEVKVHTDAKASASAEAVGANAYTVGSDIVFRSGHFDPASTTGQRTIAHELSHVVQQRSGPVDGTDAPGGIRLSDPGDRFEQAADATADEIVSGSTAQLEREDSTDGAVLQRQMGDEDEEEEVPEV